MKTRLSILLLAVASLCGIACNGTATGGNVGDAGPAIHVETPNDIEREASEAQQAKLFAMRQAAAARKPSAVIPRAQQVANLLAFQNAAAKPPAAPGTFAAAPSPVFPKSWSITDWYTDDQNVTGLASDNNDCQTPTTPCATFNEIVYHRWGTITPVLGGPTASDTFIVNVHALSAWSNNQSDSVVANPKGGFLDIIGPIGAVNQIATGTLASVIAKNPNTQQPLTATLAGGLALGEIVHNTTHDSYAFLATNVSGNVWVLSQPLDPNTGVEVDTWANTNAYTVYKPINLNLNYLGYNTFVEFVTIDVSLGGSGNTYIDSIEEVFSSLKLPLGQPGMVATATCIGCDIAGGSTVWNGGSWAISGGLFRGGNNMQGDMQVSNDFINAGLLLIPRFPSSVGKVWLSPGSMLVAGPVALSNYITGTGVLQIAGGGSTLTYGTSAMTGTQLFLLSGAIEFNHSSAVTTGNSTFTVGNTVTQCGGITLSGANLDVPASATCATTGFGGNAFEPGGGSITKF